MTEARKMQRRFLIALITVGALIGILVIMGATFVCYGSGQVLTGIKARDVELQGLNKEKGIIVLRELEKKILASPVYLKYKWFHKCLLQVVTFAGDYSHFQIGKINF